MDYLDYKCPVCDKNFHANDDVVVCPECGAPHHRECFEKENRCHFADKHKDGFDYQEYIGVNDTNTREGEIICPACKEKNPKGTFFCRKCGNPLTADSFSAGQNSTDNQSSQNGQPPFVIDPMGGVDPKEILDETVTAGDASRLVKSNTPYFMRIFYNIKKFSKSRFNFSAFLFGGGYFLYRKMYGIGTLLTALMLVLAVVPIFVAYSPAFTDIFNELMSIAGISEITAYSDILTLANAGAMLSFDKLFFFSLPIICEFNMLALRLVCGFCANRVYFKHCMKQLKTANKELENDAEREIFFNAKGGVNTPLGVSLLVAYLIISYLPMILSSFNII